mmetsp:Transcript_73056/g.194088  ORF Transcript_73056/g.194088 Transcript_73056/m.194088 type:complete len:338 (+) Transcript_73056:515-1528(+)
MTFSKPTFWPRNAKRRRSNRARSGPAAAKACLRLAMARALTAKAPARNCTKLAAALGSVRLKSSRESSSLRILMVSAMATSSSARVFTISSHSDFFVSQSLSMSAKNSLSAMRDSSVSERPAFICATETARSPERRILDSMASESAATSFFLAATSSSKDLTPASSAAVASTRDCFISSPSCLRMPVMLPLPGTYPEPCEPSRKASSVCRSSSERLSPWVPASFRSREAASVWRNPPAMPLSSAATAPAIAPMFASSSDFSAAKAAASFSRMPVASAIASLAALRSTCACLRSSSSCTFFSSEALISEPKLETFPSAPAMLASSSPLPFLQWHTNLS